MHEAKSVPPVPVIYFDKLQKSNRTSRALKAEVLAGPYGMGRLMKAMREASGLTTRQIAMKMGIARESLSQYFWQRVGKGGSSRLSWFLRFSDACGCRVYITFPSLEEQHQMVVVAPKFGPQKVAHEVEKP